EKCTSIRTGTRRSSRALQGARQSNLEGKPRWGKPCRSALDHRPSASGPFPGLRRLAAARLHTGIGWPVGPVIPCVLLAERALDPVAAGTSGAVDTLHRENALGPLPGSSALGPGAGIGLPWRCRYHRDLDLWRE